MKLAKLVIALAITLHVVSFLLMLKQVEPFYSYFYSIAWWTYIFFLAGVNHLKAGNSLIFDRPREGLWAFFFSTTLWLFFEIFNFRLDNWNYTGVPIQTYVRWPGYFIAFGTVLPGIFETETMVRNLGIANRIKLRPLRITGPLLVRFMLLGTVMMIGPVLAPQWFFPFVWLGLIFLLDPLLYWSSEAHDESFSAQAERGDYSLLLRLLIAGMICGLLWEFWNFWAGSKWIYSVPKLAFLKLFEMPFLGFFGFPPFALECYLAYRLSVLVRERYLRGNVVKPALILVLAAIYCVLVFKGIDRYNVWTFSV
ncbi:MAG: hypothetical protein EHM23_29710 [Acidobacteria bacterium]|nr:MAG: hypothetical protein EHM23_29710 [Acidobacteriota bacterium]